MAQRTGPKEYFGDRIRLDIFNKVKVAWIAKHIGVSYQTVYQWKKNPGSMPAWRYFQILNEMEVNPNWTE